MRSACFLHATDRSVSYDEMLLGVNELYQEDFSYVALILNAAPSSINGTCQRRIAVERQVSCAATNVELVYFSPGTSGKDGDKWLQGH